MRRIIGLNVRGRTDPEMYRVCNDLYQIVGKMLRADVQDSSAPDLWISEADRFSRVALRLDAAPPDSA